MYTRSAIPACSSLFYHLFFCAFCTRCLSTRALTFPPHSSLFCASLFFGVYTRSEIPAHCCLFLCVVIFVSLFFFRVFFCVYTRSRIYSPNTPLFFVCVFLFLTYTTSRTFPLTPLFFARLCFACTPRLTFTITLLLLLLWVFFYLFFLRVHSISHSSP